MPVPNPVPLLGTAKERPIASGFEIAAHDKSVFASCMHPRETLVRKFCLRK